MSRPFEHDGATSSWVIPVVLAGSSPAVLKQGMSHMEGEHEIQGLRFWDGVPTVRLLGCCAVYGGCRPLRIPLAQAERWQDMGLVSEGLRVFDALAQPSSVDVLLATDLNAGNVLRSEREPWLVIDPKPFIGDPAYDATQHMLNCKARLRSDPRGLVNRMADLLEVDRERVRLWTFARLATTERCADIARAIAP